jgi:hypothetical protein
MQAGDVIEGLFKFRDDPGELYRHAADVLDRFWEENDSAIRWLDRAFSIATSSLGAEVVALAVLLGDTLV